MRVDREPHVVLQCVNGCLVRKDEQIMREDSQGKTKGKTREDHDVQSCPCVH